ncbi:MAG: hypothetical protein KC609_01425, partial [Myxococcales bacterium]|nr:hypothetical protein [Myxococcales bacterium]
SRIDDPDARISRAAFKALGVLGNFDALARLRRYIAQSPTISHAEMATRTIDKIRKQNRSGALLLQFGRRLDKLDKAQREMKEKLDRLGRRKH